MNNVIDMLGYNCNWFIKDPHPQARWSAPVVPSWGSSSSPCPSPSLSTPSTSSTRRLRSRIRSWRRRSWRAGRITRRPASRRSASTPPASGHVRRRQHGKATLSVAQTYWHLPDISMFTQWHHPDISRFSTISPQERTQLQLPRAERW